MADGARVICAGADLVECGAAVRFDVEVGGRSAPAFVLRYRGSVHAYLNRCAHLGVELDWLPGRFFDDSGLYLICATHGATYAPDTGRCVHGPCKGQALVPVGVFEQDGKVFLK